MRAWKIVLSTLFLLHLSSTGTKAESGEAFPPVKNPKTKSKATKNGTKPNRYYFIRYGDTPWSVSEMLFGTPRHAWDLRDAVGGTDHWHAGVLLRYTSPDQADDKTISFYEARGVSPSKTTVGDGETLRAIAKREFGAHRSWTEIAWLNNMQSAEEAQPGQQIWTLPSTETIGRFAGVKERRSDETYVAQSAPAQETAPAETSTFATTSEPYRENAAAPTQETSSANTAGATSLQTTASAPAPERKELVPWTFPGINISSPPGYGADWGAVFVGAGVQSRGRNNNTTDGAMGAGFGLGDANKYVGLEVGVSMLSFQNPDRGGIALKVSRRLPSNFGVAIGRENAVTWGTTDAPKSWYGSVSRMFQLKQFADEWFSAFTLTAGVGNGRFLPESKLLARQDGINVFGSAAIRIQQPVSFIADWAGQDLNLGLSITPLRNWGLFVNPSLADVTGNAGNGARFLLGVGFGYIFI